jgi:cell division septal protein FtsQ
MGNVMTRRRVWLALSVLVVAAGVLALPTALRRTGFFRIRQVELVGLRYQQPDSVLARLGLEAERHLFQSVRAIEERARAMPAIAAVRVKRRLPGTLRIVVEERRPVAFVPSQTGMIAVDGDASPLAYEPAVTGFDLPLIERADSVVVGTLAAVRATDSLLYRRVSSARRGDGDAVILELESEWVVLRGVPTTLDIVAVETVRRHLEARGLGFDRLDARFPRKVFVRLSGV